MICSFYHGDRQLFARSQTIYGLFSKGRLGSNRDSQVGRIKPVQAAAFMVKSIQREQPVAGLVHAALANRHGWFAKPIQNPLTH